MVQLGARWYDPALGRFLQPDTIIPNAGNPQTFNRYSYGLNNPVKYVDPTGHEAECQSWDTTCWEDRYYDAHGLCRNSAGEYKRQCAVEFKDKDILGEVLGEKDGLAIVEKADPVQVLSLLAQTFSGRRLNIATIGYQIASGGGAYGALGLQVVFDFKHNQIGLFVNGEGGGLVPSGDAISWQFGIGSGGDHFKDIRNFEEWFVGAGGSVTPFLTGGPGGGVDVLFSASWNEALGKLDIDPDNVVMAQLSFNISTPGGEAHWYASYGLNVIAPVSFGGGYAGDYKMTTSTFAITYALTANPMLAAYFAGQTLLVDYEDPKR